MVILNVTESQKTSIEAVLTYKRADSLYGSIVNG